MLGRQRYASGRQVASDSDKRLTGQLGPSDCSPYFCGKCCIDGTHANRSNFVRHNLRSARITAIVRMQHLSAIATGPNGFFARSGNRSFKVIASDFLL